VPSHVLWTRCHVVLQHISAVAWPPITCGRRYCTRHPRVAIGHRVQHRQHSGQDHDVEQGSKRFPRRLANHGDSYDATSGPTRTRRSIVEYEEPTTTLGGRSVQAAPAAAPGTGPGHTSLRARAGGAQSTGTSHRQHVAGSARTGGHHHPVLPLLSKQHSAHPPRGQDPSLAVAGPAEKTAPPSCLAQHDLTHYGPPLRRAW
jgi:hypothetical protein